MNLFSDLCNASVATVPLEAKTHVRSRVHLSIYEFKETGKETTQVTRITQIDPCGSIPVPLVNMYAGNLVDMFNRWKKE